MAQEKSKYDVVKALDPYYRDTFTQDFLFSNLGKWQVEFVVWALNSTDTIRVTELLGRMAPSGLPAEQDLALKLMIYTIMHANQLLTANLPSPNSKFPAMEDNIRRGVQRILALDPQPAYFTNCMQLLYRIGAVEEMVEMSRMNARLFNENSTLRAIMGFVHTITGDYATGLERLQPLLKDTQKRYYANVRLSDMTCRYFLGQTPQTPVSFDSLDKATDDLDRQIALLPPMRMQKPIGRPASRPIILVACNDEFYAQPALHLAYSLDASNSGKLALHLHLYAPNLSTLAEVERLRERLPGLEIGISTEDGATPIPSDAIYYSTVRFVRFYEAMQYYQSPLCLVDADALLMRSWEVFDAMLQEKTEMVLCGSSAAPFWERVAAGFLYCRPGETSRHYLAKVAQFILTNIERGSMIWFADQIALSACDDRFTKDAPNVLHIKPELLMDTSLGAQALTWVVTNNKHKQTRYEAQRELLGKRYGQLASGTMQHILTHISKTHAPVFFLQIGAMDGVSYDPIHPFVKNFGWKGILVEPLPDMIQQLQANYAQTPGLIFENIAITEQAETRTLYRIPPEAAKKANLPHWVLGMSSFVPGKLDAYKQHVVEQPVSCLPLAALLTKQAPEKIDVLQIDTEGWDYTILRQFDFTRYQPAVINFEWVNLKPEEKLAAAELLMQHGYIFYETDLDMLAVRRDIFFTAP